MATSESGTATAGIAVARAERRNTNTTAVTRRIEISSVRSTSCTEARIVPARSSATSTSMAGEIDFESSGNKAFTFSITSMMFAPGSRRTMIETTRSPSYQPATFWFSTSSVTVAMSPSLMPPPAHPSPPDQRTITFRHASASSSWSSTEIACHCVSPTPPVGEFAVALASDVRTSSRLMPSPARWAGSTRTRTAGCTPPPTPTCPTPGTCAIFCASTVFAASNTSGSVNDFERSARMRIGESEGFTLR